MWWASQLFLHHQVQHFGYLQAGGSAFPRERSFFHHHQLPDYRPYRIVLGNIHHGLSSEDIITCLQNESHSVVRVHTPRNKSTLLPLNMRFIGLKKRKITSMLRIFLLSASIVWHGRNPVSITVTPRHTVLGILFAQNVQKTTPLRSVGSNKKMPDAAITVKAHAPLKFALKPKRSFYSK